MYLAAGRMLKRRWDVFIVASIAYNRVDRLSWYFSSRLQATRRDAQLWLRADLKIEKKELGYSPIIPTHTLVRRINEMSRIRSIWLTSRFMRLNFSSTIQRRKLPTCIAYIRDPSSVRVSSKHERTKLRAQL